MPDDRLEQLLDVWMLDRDRGVTRTASEVCAECPELEPELSRRMQVVSRFELLAEVGSSETLGSQGEVDTSHLSRAPTPVSLKNARLPALIGNFKPLEILGEGGMGAVYLAEDRQLGRRVAVKVMKKELAADPDAKHRFLREARAMATIEHDNIMTIYAVGEDQGTPFLVMPVLKGETLENRLGRENRLSITESLRISREIAAGLAAAHAHGLVHRDIKPSNIWLEGTQGRVRILDFGLARPATDDQKVTQSGAVLGTPAYMAPEQAAGTEATSRSDLFSLGAVMYRMTTGQQPFAGPNMMATLNNLANRIPESPSKLNTEIPSDLSTLIERLISKVPERRPASADAVVESLQSVETVSLRAGTKTAMALKKPLQKRKPREKTEKDRLESPASSRDQRPRIPRNVFIGGMAGFLLLFAAVVYRIVTDQGTFILAIEENDQIAARLNKGGLVIEDAKSGQTWHLTPDKPEKTVPSGDYKLRKPDGLLLRVTDESGTEFTTAEFKIKRGDQRIVSVTLAPDAGLFQQVADNPAVNDDVASAWTGWPTDAPAPAVAPFDATQANQYQEAWAKHLGVPVEYTNSVDMKFVLIPPGEFTMGSTPEEMEETLAVGLIADPQNKNGGVECTKSSAPLHRVVVTQPFYMGVNEVTQAQYELVMGTNPSLFAATGRASADVQGMDTSIYPVDSINWNDAAAYCATLSNLENPKPSNLDDGVNAISLNGLGYRLPTEAEWEFACRAGTAGTELIVQDQDLKPPGWYEPYSGSRPHAVGELKPNAFGLCDMRGNVWEWVEDWLDYDFYSQFVDSPAIDPRASASGVPKHVFRGGSWSDTAPICRSSTRGAFDPVARFGSFGFRVALSARAVKVETQGRMMQRPPAPTEIVPFGESPLDQLDASLIPEAERLDYLPKEVVAVMGTHEPKTWGSPFYTTHGNLSYSPDGKWICACDFSNVYIFDARTFKLRKQIPHVSGLSYSSRCIAFSSDSRKLFTGWQVSSALAPSALVTDLSQPELQTMRLPELLGTDVIAVSPDDRQVAMVPRGKHHEILLGTRDFVTSAVQEPKIVPDIAELPQAAELGRIRELAFSPDGHWLIAGHEVGGYRILRKQSDEFVPVAVVPAQMPLYNTRVVYSFTADHKRALLLGSDVCHLLDLSLPPDLPVPTAGLEVESPKELSGVADLSVSADGNTWAASQNTLGTNSQLLIGDWINGRPHLKCLIPVPGIVTGHIALSPDGNQVATNAHNQLLRVFDLTQDPPHERTTTAFTYTAVSSDGGRAVTVGTDGVIRLEEIGGEEPRLLDSRRVDRALMHVCVSSDGKRAVTKTRPDLYTPARSQIQIWNLEHGTLEEFAAFETSDDRRWAWPVLFAGGSRFLYGNQVWDITTKTPEVIAEFSQMPASPAACAVSEDNQEVAFVTAEGLLSVYQIDRPDDPPTATVQMPSAAKTLNFSAEGDRLVTSSESGDCIVWDLTDGQLTEAVHMPFVFYHMTSAVFSRDGQRVYFSGWSGFGEWKLDENKVTRSWNLPGFSELSTADDGRYLFLNNSNCTTWILRLPLQ